MKYRYITEGYFDFIDKKSSISIEDTKKRMSIRTSSITDFYKCMFENTDLDKIKYTFIAPAFDNYSATLNELLQTVQLNIDNVPNNCDKSIMSDIIIGMLSGLDVIDIHSGKIPAGKFYFYTDYINEKIPMFEIDVDSNLYSNIVQYCFYNNRFKTPLHFHYNKVKSEFIRNSVDSAEVHITITYDFVKVLDLSTLNDNADKKSTAEFLVRDIISPLESKDISISANKKMTKYLKLFADQLSQQLCYEKTGKPSISFKITAQCILSDDNIRIFDQYLKYAGVDREFSPVNGKNNPLFVVDV